MMPSAKLDIYQSAELLSRLYRGEDWLQFLALNEVNATPGFPPIADVLIQDGKPGYSVDALRTFAQSYGEEKFKEADFAFFLERQQTLLGKDMQERLQELETLFAEELEIPYEDKFMSERVTPDSEHFRLSSGETQALMDRLHDVANFQDRIAEVLTMFAFTCRVLATGNSLKKEEAKAINRQIDSLAEDAYEKHREVREIMHAIMTRCDYDSGSRCSHAGAEVGHA